MKKSEISAALMPMIRKKTKFVLFPVPDDFVRYNRKLVDMKSHIRKTLAAHGIKKDDYNFSDPDRERYGCLSFVVGYK